MYAQHKLGFPLEGRPHAWDMIDWLRVDSIDTVNSMVAEFNQTRWEFGCLPAIAKADQIVDKIDKDRFDVVAITCCSIDTTTVSLRRANLYHVFGDVFQDVICLPLNTSKKEALSKFKDKDVVAWIEDKPSAALDGKELGFKSFLIRCEHNRKFEDENPEALNYVTDWLEINNALNLIK